MLGVVVHDLDPRIREAEMADLQEFDANLTDIRSLRLVRAIQ